MQLKPVIACVSLLAGALVALPGTTAQAASTSYETGSSPALGLPSIDHLDGKADNTRPAAGPALYVAPNGSESAAGTESAPTTLASAIARVTPGGTIYLRGGTYRFSQTVTIPPGKDGTSTARTELSAYPGETPVLNFSAMSEDPANRGLAVNGAFWHVQGIVVEHAGDNGIFIGGSNNVIERTVTRFNHDSGLQLSRISSSTPATSGRPTTSS